MKICVRCNKSQHKSEFRQLKNRLKSWCNTCCAEYKKNYVRSEAGLIKDRKTRDAYAKTPAGIRAYKTAHENDYINNYDKHFARYTLNNAIRHRKIIKPTHCSECNSSSDLHGHHTDYSNPLDVIWLCIPCHVEEHTRLRRAA